MYYLELSDEADKTLGKLSKKDPVLLKKVIKKIDEIRSNPFHQYKFLRKPLHGLNRVHIDKHFVLIFEIRHKKNAVLVWNFAHHDEAYRKAYK